MNKFALILISSLIALPVHAEARLTDVRLGIPCNSIPEIEKRLGSSELTTDDPGGINKYSGTHGGEKATVIYHCSEKKLTEQTIIVTTTSREQAYRFAQAQKTELAGHLGDPIHDGLKLALWKRLFFGFLGADLDYLSAVVVWGRATEDVMILIRETDVNLWQVFISQGSSKLEYILNS